MSGNLYQILDIDKDATPDQVRKAYKKKALQTHPDRLPAGATAEDKTLSEEQFRNVNNAYEVLIDPQNRKTYDMHGIWPPPDTRSDYRARPTHAGRHHHHHRHHYQQPPFGGVPNDFFDPFPDHFDHHPRMPFAFTDPFTLFNSIFGDLNRFDMHPFQHPGNHFSRQRSDDHFFPERRMGLVDNIFNAMARPIPAMGSSSMIMQSESVNFPGNGGWTQEMHMTTTVNGVTQTIHKRRDSEGNEHVTRTFPDGRETYTVNGIEQSPPRSRQDRYIGLPSFPGTHRRRSATTGSARHDYTQPPPPPLPITYNSPPSYTSSRNVYRPGDRPHRRHQQNPENAFPVIPDTDSPPKRWWHSSRP